MARPPAPVFNPANPVNPNVGYSTSGDPQDWHVHLQTVDIMYVRRNQYNADTSSSVTAPTVTSNWLDMVCTVQTQDEIYLNVDFSSVDSSDGLVFQPHVLQLQGPSGIEGGFGEDGVVSTSAMGIIRRLCEKDAAGTILDPTGVCTQTVNMVMDQMPGAYDVGYDTSATVNGILAQAMGQLTAACPTFKSTLVDL